MRTRDRISPKIPGKQKEDDECDPEYQTDIGVGWSWVIFRYVRFVRMEDQKTMVRYIDLRWDTV